MKKFDLDSFLDEEIYTLGNAEHKQKLMGQNEHSFAKWKSLWEGNCMMNRRIIGDNFTYLTDLYDGRFEGTNMLIIAAGPSVKNEWYYIKRAQRNGYFIIAVDRIYEDCKENGITPDLTFTLDAQSVVASWFKSHTPEENFAVAATSNIATLGTLKDANIYMYGLINPFQTFWQEMCVEHWGRRIQAIISGRIVTNAAVDFAIHAGASTIITIGNDLHHKVTDLKSVSDIKGYKAVKYISIQKSNESGKCRGIDNCAVIPAFEGAAVQLMWFKNHYPEINFVDCSKQIFDTGWRRMTLAKAIDKFTPKKKAVA